MTKYELGAGWAGTNDEKTSAKNVGEVLNLANVRTLNVINYGCPFIPDFYQKQPGGGGLGGGIFTVF